MTAEVVIINQHGVAMAADSAVTIGGRKIINSAIKLFSLSKKEPVGIMVYGNASLLNIPWETLIKLFRKTHTSALNTLEDYGKAFMDFLESKADIFNEHQEDEWILYKVEEMFELLTSTLQSRLKLLQDKGEEITQDKIYDAIEILLVEMKEILTSNEKIYKDELDNLLEMRISPIIEKCITRHFPFAALKSNLSDLLKEIGKLSITNCAPLGVSGIVIAGFGDEDIFPSVMTYEIFGILNGRILQRIHKDKTIINTNSAPMQSNIIPFAQEDVVRSFLDGVHPEILDYMIDFTKDTVANLLDSALVSLTDNVSGAGIANYLSEIIKTEVTKFYSSNMLKPMLNMIQSLPKDELASMAEDLVNMTAFRRKMAFSSMETVGGPVDVAVISKGDGLVWVKRKHYFPKDLNAHFFENYFK